MERTPNYSTQELVRRWATTDCHISLAIAAARLERQGHIGAATALRNVLDRAVADHKKTLPAEELVVEK